MKNIQLLFFIFTIVVFLLGGYVYSTMDMKEMVLNMESKNNQHKENFSSMSIFSNTGTSLEGWRNKEGLRGRSDGNRDSVKGCTQASSVGVSGRRSSRGGSGGSSTGSSGGGDSGHGWSSYGDFDDRIIPSGNPRKTKNHHASDDGSDDSDDSCPDLLIKSGSELQLFNTKKAYVYGKNPVIFKNLDDYIRYLEIQRKTGKICPVLYLQKENDAQGNDIYRARPSPFNQAGGLPALPNFDKDHGQSINTRPPRNSVYELPPELPITSNLFQRHNDRVTEAKDASREYGYNQNNYPGFDPHGQYIGRITDVDEVGLSTQKGLLSENPMDPNWGGVLYTQSAVESGKYDDNNVTRSSYPTPKTSFIPIPNPDIPPMPRPV